MSADQRLGMHDHIEEMGRNIVRRSHPDEPIKHSRLWIHGEIEDVLSHDLVTEATRAIATSISWYGENSKVFTKGFGNLKKLRFLHVTSYTDTDDILEVDKIFPNSDTYRFFEVDQIFPNALQFLSWSGYPHWCLPETFQANNLVVLELPYSKISRLWGRGEEKVLKNLKFLDLQGTVLRTLDCGLLPNLEKLNIQNCGFGRNYKITLHAPSGCLSRFVYLNLRSCRLVEKQLQSLVKQLQSLQVLDLTNLDLKEFPDIGRSSYFLLELYFSGNNIKELPSSIGNLEKLVHLNLGFCINLKSLPQNICKLRCLKELFLDHSSIEELPEDLGNLESLVLLSLAHTCVKHLPDSICKLKHLESLGLRSCSALTKLPEDLGLLASLNILDIANSRIKRCSE